MNPSDPYSSDFLPTGDVTRAGHEQAGGATGTAAKAKRAAGKALDSAKEKVASVATDRKEAAAGRIGGYSDRLRATAESASEEDPNIAHFATQAADRLQEVADYVRDADFSRLRQDAASLAHRHPALFMGGMLVAGLVLGNLAKASVQTLREDDSHSGNGEGMDDSFSSPNADFSDGNTAPNGPMGGISDSFDAEPRQDDPRF